MNCLLRRRGIADGLRSACLATSPVLVCFAFFLAVHRHCRIQFCNSLHTWILSPLSSSWVTIILQIFTALDISHVIDCYWEGILDLMKGPKLWKLWYSGVQNSVKLLVKMKV